MKKLTLQHRFYLRPIAPFHFDATVHKPSHFPSSDKLYSSGTLWQTMRFHRKVLGIKLLNRGSTNKPLVHVSIYANSQLSRTELSELKGEIAYRHDMCADLLQFYAAFYKDPLLSSALRRWRGMRVSAGESLYEFVIISIVLQNATVRRSVQMLESLFQAFGGKSRLGRKVLSYYWLPIDIARSSETQLRNIKLGYRARAIYRISCAFAGKKFNEKHLRQLPTHELKERLLNIYGIGPASVWYLLFEVFHRYDALEYISPWEQKIYSRLLFGKEMVSQERIFRETRRRWGQWRMLAVHYMFEDIFWQKKRRHIPWLEALIRL